MMKILYMILSLCTIFSCASTNDKERSEAQEDAKDPYLAKTTFNKPLARPLGQVLLSWTLVEGAEGYELQCSDSENFENVVKNWTLSGTQIEIPREEGIHYWYRVRSFTLDTMSRWSSSLQLSERVLQ